MGKPKLSDLVLGRKKSGKRISQRMPTADAATENPLTDNLVIDTNAIRSGGLLEKNVDRLMETTPGVRTSARTPEGRLAAYQEHVADNLDFLYRQMEALPNNVVGIAKNWYRGANRLASGLANKYGVSIEQAAGVLAALSPQKDWYQNVSLASRVLEGYKRGIEAGTKKPSAEHRKTLNSIYGKNEYAADVKSILSKPFSDLTDTQKAMWVRSYDEAFHDRGYDIVSPSGKSMGPALTKAGKEATTAWGNNIEIAKAIRVVEDGSIESISSQMGSAHKVRNFYNNIVSPEYAKDLPEVADVTMDTHAIAAGHLAPWSGSSDAVKANFGTLKGVPSSKITGARGAYGINADAYRQFASNAGIMPREGQSVTWEAVRSLYPRQWKNVDNETAILGIWDDYQKGRVNLETARSLILEKAEGVDAPDWARGRSGADDAGSKPTIQQGEVSGASVSQSAPDGVDSGTGINVAGVLSALGITTGLTSAFYSPDTEAGIRGYHGSPAKFDQFSDEFIGTGEGAQQYGRGHYLAEVEDTAVDYRNQLTPRDYDYEEWLHAKYKEAEAREDYVRMEMYENAMMHESPDEIRDRYSDYDEDYQALADEVASEIEAYGPKRGYVYQTNVDADLDDLIDYDLPLSQQSQKVQEVMASFGITDPDLKGYQLYYKVIDPETPEQQAPELATRTLNEAGIKGIRYADGFSRGQDGGTSNYVIFDPRIIDISRRYGIPVTEAAVVGTGITTLMASEYANSANARKMQAESNTNFAATRDSKNNMWDGLKKSVPSNNNMAQNWMEMRRRAPVSELIETMGRGLTSGVLGVLGNLPMEGSLGRMGLDYFGIGPEQVEGYREDIKADPIFYDPDSPFKDALSRAMETSLQYISPYVSEFTSQPEIRATLGSIGDWYSNLSPRNRGILSGAGETLANLPK